MSSASELRQRVVIEASAESTDAHGQVRRVWSPEAARWAAVRQLSGSELMIAQQAGSAATFEVKLRHYAGLTNDGHRIIFEGNVLNIESIIDPDATKTWTVVLCKVGA